MRQGTGRLRTSVPCSYKKLSYRRETARQLHTSAFNADSRPCITFLVQLVKVFTTCSSVAASTRLLASIMTPAASQSDVSAAQPACDIFIIAVTPAAATDDKLRRHYSILPDRCFRDCNSTMHVVFFFAELWLVETALQV